MDFHGILYTVLSLIAAKRIYGLNYVEVFRDDFDGNTINGSKWNRVSIPSTVNNELQYYLPDETYQANGLLYIRSQKRSFGDRNYTSGRVDTKDKFKFLYGEVEWKAKLPKGQGIWPALWLLQWQCPPASPCTTWPPEVDVVEARGDQPNKITTTLHYGRYPNNNYDTKEIFGPDFSADYHTYKAIWDPDYVAFLVDDKEVYRVSDKNHVPREELYVIMNVAVGGFYSGNPDDSTQFPTNFLVDYVTVHQWK